MMKPLRSLLLSVTALSLVATALAKDESVPVTVENFIRAESDLYFSAVAGKGGFGKLDHARTLAPIDSQTVIRLNRDTLYSSAVFDLDAGPVTLTIPDTKGRFISLQVINEDHSTLGVFYKPGEYTLDRKSVGTRYVVVAFRILVDPKKPGDVEAVNAIQDAIEVRQASAGVFEVPKWDAASQSKVRDALLTLADTLPDRNGMFGKKEELDPVRRLLGAASAWGGNPDKEAMYLNVFPKENDGKTIYRLTVKEVPVKDFWSISIYNAKGYYEKNAEEIYTLNNLTAVKNEDGSVTIQFGGKQGEAPNVLPIMPGWNYMVRLYRPAPEVLSGEWKFPQAEPVGKK